jgi:hypothetical protein
MIEFANLASLDLSGNRVPLEQLHKLMALEELSLACNNLRAIRLPYQGNDSDDDDDGDDDGDDDAEATPAKKTTTTSSIASSPRRVNLDVGFASLSRLDLSFNRLSVSAVRSLQQLPALTELDVSNNGLRTFPAGLSGFGRLRKLSLKSNKLGGANAPRAHLVAARSVAAASADRKLGEGIEEAKAARLMRRIKGQRRRDLKAKRTAVGASAKKHFTNRESSSSTTTVPAQAAAAVTSAAAAAAAASQTTSQTHSRTNSNSLSVEGSAANSRRPSVEQTTVKFDAAATAESAISAAAAAVSAAASTASSVRNDDNNDAVAFAEEITLFKALSRLPSLVRLDLSDNYIRCAALPVQVGSITLAFVNHYLRAFTI